MSLSRGILSKAILVYVLATFVGASGYFNAKPADPDPEKNCFCEVSSAKTETSNNTIFYL